MMKKSKLVTLLTTATLVAGSVVPALAHPMGYGPNGVGLNQLNIQEFPGGKVFADYMKETDTDDTFRLQFEGGQATNATIRQYLADRGANADTIDIQFVGWEKSTLWNSDPVEVKVWKLTYTGTTFVYNADGTIKTDANKNPITETKTETITIKDRADKKAVEHYELDYTEDSKELRQLTSKIQRMQREPRSYMDDQFNSYTGARYHVSYDLKTKPGYALVEVSENGKYFWRHEGNHNLNGLEVYERDVVLTATIKLDADKSGIEKFVHNIYRVALNRTPDQAGYQYWTNALRAQDCGGREILVNLLNSEEFKGLTISGDEFINRMYNVILDRTPDEEGKAYWVNLYNEVLKAKIEYTHVYGGDAEFETRMHIIDAMLRGSSEFQTRCENMGVRY